MKKFIKIASITLVVIFALLLTLPFLFKGTIISLAKEEANKTVEATINFNDIGLSLIKNFPNFSLTIDQLSVVGKNQFEGDTLITINTLNLTLDLMSVLNGTQYEIRKILIDKPIINLKVLADSSANWDIAKADSLDNQKSASDSTSAFKIAMKNFVVKGGIIRYTDQPNKTFSEIKGLDMNLSGDLTAETTTLAIESEVASIDVDYSGIRYLSQAKAKFDADVKANMTTNTYTFEDNNLTINNLSVQFSGWLKMLSDGYDMDINFSTPTTDFKSALSMIPAIYSKQFSDIKTDGSFSLKGYLKGVYQEESLPSFGIDLAVSNAMFQYPSLPSSVNKININASVANKGGSADNTSVDVKKFHMEIAGNPVDFTLHLATPVSDPNMAMTAKGLLELSSLEKVYPMDQKIKGKVTADLSIAGKMSDATKQNYNKFKAEGMLKLENMSVASTEIKHELTIQSLVFQFTPEFLDLASFEGSMGSSDFKGSGKITQYLDYVLKGGILKGNLNLSSSMINIDELMPDQSEAVKTDTSAMAMGELPDRIKFVTSCSIGKLRYDKMEMTNVKGQVTLDDKKLWLDNLSMNAFGGSMQTKGHIATPTEKPIELNFMAEMSQVDLQQLSASFSSIDSIAPILKKISGKAGMTINFSTLLNSDLTPDLNSIQSHGTLNTSQLIAENIDVMDQAANLLKMDNLRRLKISPTSLSYIIENGKLIVKPFDIKVDQFTGTLGGNTELSTQSLDYVLALQIPRSTFGSAANSVVDGLVAEVNKKGIAYEPGKNIGVDLVITGKAKSPKVSMKLGKSGSGGSMADDLKAKANEEFNKKKQELENQAKAEIEKQKAAAEAKLKQEQEKLKQEVDKRKKELEAKAKKEADSLKKKLENEAKKKLKKFF